MYFSISAYLGRLVLIIFIILFLFCLIMFSLLTLFSALSYFLAPLMLLPYITSKIKYLHSNPCLRACFSGTQTTRSNAHRGKIAFETAYFYNSYKTYSYKNTMLGPFQGHGQDQCVCLCVNFYRDLPLYTTVDTG